VDGHAEGEKNGAKSIKEWVHFGLTSQDINNTAIPLSWKIRRRI